MSNNVTKAELITSAAETADVSKAIAEKVLKAVLDNIQEALEEQKSVTLVGFGTFSVGQRQARNGRNPKTGKPIQIPASVVPKFKPGKGLKDAVNGA